MPAGHTPSASPARLDPGAGDLKDRDRSRLRPHRPAYESNRTVTFSAAIDTRMPPAHRLSVAFRLRYVLLTVVLVGVPIAGNAQERDDARTRLLRASSIRCQFQEGTKAAWEGGSLNIETAEEKEEVTFDSIDPESGTARLIAEMGAADVRVMRTEVGFTFLDVTDAGNPVITTVFAFEVPGRQSRYIAVDSHHMGWPVSFPWPESDTAPVFALQYHGTCEMLE